MKASASVERREEMVNAAQRAWCDGLVLIGAVHAEGGDVRTVASELVDELYDYAEGTVFFKATLASERTPSAVQNRVRFLTS